MKGIKMKTATSEINGSSVTVGAFKDGIIFIESFSPESLGQVERRVLFDALAEAAAAKIGSNRDRRFNGGWSLATV